LKVGHIMDHLEAAVVDADGKIVPRGQRGDCKIMKKFFNF